MIPLLALATPAAGLVALLGRTFPAGDRAWSRLAASFGLAFAVPLAFAGGSWRAVAATRPEAIAIAAGVAAAWACVLIVPARPGWRTTPLTGIAASGAALAGFAEWSVPAVLFLLCALVACVVDMLMGGARKAASLTAAGGVMLGVSVGLARGSSWELPHGAAGSAVGAAALGLVLVAAGAYVVSSRRPSSLAPALPLLMVGLGLMGRFLDRPHPAIAAVVLAAGSALALALGAAGREGLTAWAISVALASVLLVPAYAVAATLALLLALLARIARAPARRDPSYGPLLVSGVAAFMPLTLGFVVLAAVVRRTFEEVVGASDAAASAPWVASALLLLAAFAAALWLAMGAARTAVAVPGWRAASVPGAIAGTAFLLGALPRQAAGLDGSPLGAEGGVFLLQGCALAAGAAAAWFALSREDATIDLVEESVEEPVPVPARIQPEPRGLAVFALAVLGLGAAAAAWLTIKGLLVGFL